MAIRMTKFTPVAASVALTLGLTGCFSDNDNNNYTPPAESFTATDTALFNVELTGKAVKGAMKNAVVTVTTLDASGQQVPVAFRLAASAEAESFTGTGSTQAAADAAAAASILAANPEDVLTSESGAYSIYLEDDFSGPVYITVKTAAEGDDSYLRCDAYMGCGTYETAPQEGDDNDGDTAIEFGEWYKTDLTLSVVKFVPAVEDTQVAITKSLFNVGNPQNAENVTRSLKANATFLTTLVSQLLIEAEEEVDEDGVADASLNSIIQVMGPEAAFLLAPLLGDVSIGGAVDLSDVDGEEELDEGILSLSLIASTIQGLPSISDTMTKLKTGIKSGSVSGSEDTDIAELAVALQKAVTNTVNIFTAIATGDEQAIEAALVAAFVANNPGATQAEINEFTAQATGIAKTAKAAKDKAIKNGATTAADLDEAASKAKKALEIIGCTDNCEAGDAFFAELADKTTASIDASELDLLTLKALVESAQGDLLEATELGGETITDAQSAIAFAVAVDALVESVETDQVTRKSNRLVSRSQGLVATAKLLVKNSSTYQQILDDANILLNGSAAEAGKVRTFNAALAQLVADATAALEEFDAEVAYAKTIAENAASAAKAQETLTTAAEGESTAALSSAQAQTTDNAVNAAQALELAMDAVSSASAFDGSVDKLELLIESAQTAAKAYLDAAESDDDKGAAQTLIDDAEAMLEEAQSQAELAQEQFEAALALQKVAQEAVAKFTVLETVKETSTSLSSMTVLTDTGGNAIVVAADILSDVIDELALLGDSAQGNSTTHPGWAYDFNLDDLTLSLTNDETGEMIDAVAAYEGNKLIAAWGVKLVGENDELVELKTGTSQANSLKNCVDFVAGDIDETMIDSCIVFNFDRNVTAANVDDASILESKSWNQISITDGDSGFVGTLNLVNDDTDKESIAVLEGVSGELDFKVTGIVDSSDAQDESTLSVEVKGEAALGYTLTMQGNELSGYTGKVMAMFNQEMMSFGTATKVTNGVSISYIDGDVIDYTDVTLIDLGK